MVAPGDRLGFRPDRRQPKDDAQGLTLAARRSGLAASAAWPRDLLQQPPHLLSGQVGIRAAREVA
eukprot:6922474-Alexandrium_andersonii.AAC.1